MKHYLLLLTMILFLFACSNDPEVEAIKKHTQRVSEGTTIDNKFKLKSIEFEKSITARDSISELAMLASEDWKELQPEAIMDSIDNGIKRMEDLKLQSIKARDELREMYLRVPTTYEGELLAMDIKIEIDKETSTIQSADDIIYEYKIIQEAIAPLISNQDSILAHVYNCSYTFENVMLNNAKTERTAKFLLTPDKTKVIQELN